MTAVVGMTLAVESTTKFLTEFCIIKLQSEAGLNVSEADLKQLSSNDSEVTEEIQLFQVKNCGLFYLKKSSEH